MYYCSRGPTFTIVVEAPRFAHQVGRKLRGLLSRWVSLGLNDLRSPPTLSNDSRDSMARILYSHLAGRSRILSRILGSSCALRAVARARGSAGGNGIGFLQGGVPPPWIFWPPVELFGRTLQAILLVFPMFSSDPARARGIRAAARAYGIDDCPAGSPPPHAFLPAMHPSLEESNPVAPGATTAQDTL